MLKPFAYLKRFSGNPIINPEPLNSWESYQTFNPGALLLDEKVHIVYRAIGDDGISRFGYAASSDGYVVEDRSKYPIYEHQISHSKLNLYSYQSGGGCGGSEDPRIVRVAGDDVIFLTYTACDIGLRMALTSIRIEDFLSKRWNWAKPALISSPDEIHKNWVIFPEKIDGNYAILHSLTPQLMISYHNSLEMEPGEYIQSYFNNRAVVRENSWDSIVRGAGAPPIKTDKGWLLFYHAMTPAEYGKYKVGVMLLDLKDPSNIISRSSSPILEPFADYENSGFKPGVVYLSGAVVKGGELLLYYGASDSYVCVASCELDQLLEELV